MKIIFRGHAFAVQGAPLPSAIQLLVSVPKSMLSKKQKKCGQVCRWTPAFPEIHHRADVPCLPVLAPPSRTERRGADAVLQPDLYSGHAVCYIKKVLGLCKSTCPTFLPNFLKPSTTSEPKIRLAVGRGEGVCAQMLPSRLNICPSIYSTDNAAHFPCTAPVCNARWKILKSKFLKCFRSVENAEHFSLHYV